MLLISEGHNSELCIRKYIFRVVVSLVINALGRERAWFRAIPLSSVTVNDSGAIETEPFITVEFVEHSSISRISSLHWAIVKDIPNRYTAYKS